MRLHEVGGRSEFYNARRIFGNYARELLFRMGCTKRKGIHEHLGLVGIDSLEHNVGSLEDLDIVLTASMIFFCDVLGAEIIGLPRFGHEVDGGCLSLRHTKSGPKMRGLPVGAKVMLSRIHKYVEVRIGMSCSDPSTIDAETRGRTRLGIVLQIVLEKINQRSARLNSGRGGELLCCRDIEFDARRSTSWPGLRSQQRWINQEKRNSKKQSGGSHFKPPV